MFGYSFIKLDVFVLYLLLSKIQNTFLNLLYTKKIFFL